MAVSRQSIVSLFMVRRSGCSYQAFRETFFEHHLRDKRKSSRSDKLCYSTLDTDESTRKSGRVPTLYQVQMLCLDDMGYMKPMYNRVYLWSRTRPADIRLH